MRVDINNTLSNSGRHFTQDPTLTKHSQYLKDFNQNASCLPMSSILRTPQPNLARPSRPYSVESKSDDDYGNNSNTANLQTELPIENDSLLAKLQANEDKLNRVLQNQKWIEKQLETILTEIRNMNNATDSCFINEMHNFPITTIEMWTNFEEKLKDDEYKISIQKIMRQIGGKDATQMVRSIFNLIMKVEIQNKFNYTGQNEKYGVGGTSTLECVEGNFFYYFQK